MYNNSHSNVKGKHFISDPIEITKGVHQGNVLSPLLFNIFINNIGDDLIDNDVPVLHNSRISHLLYADDLLLSSTTEEGLQQNMDKVNVFCNKWGLSINAEKKIWSSLRMVEHVMTDLNFHWAKSFGMCK